MIYMNSTKKGKNKNSISEPEPVDEKLKFSFEYYDSSCKYCLSDWQKAEISGALNRLKEVNQKTYNDLFREKEVYHFHPVDWSTTKEKNGFPDKKVNNLEPFQFALLGINNQKARIFGARQDNIFYIVWFDLNHEVDPMTKK
ncbi:MAG: hypothetical protein AAB757_01865 [Patescibacteria group bacterium]